MGRGVSVPVSRPVLRIVVGLGNPGKEYARTRHNAGFWVVERLAATSAGRLKPDSGVARSGIVRIGDSSLLLVEPTTFVNRSGDAVRAILDRRGAAPSDLLVIHDDLDLDEGSLRLKRRGGHGGHRGVLSIISSLGTDDFLRLKVGIGRPPAGVDPTDFVLLPVDAEFWKRFEPAVDRAAEAVRCAVLEGVEAAMAKYHG